jgi:hypothetical protein
MLQVLVSSQPPRGINEEFFMTFQIGLVCKEGLVVASDSQVTYVTPPMPNVGSSQQHTKESKFIFSPNRKIACTCAGGPQAEPTARAIAMASESLTVSSEVEWRTGLGRAADSVQRGTAGRHLLDEMIVFRGDCSSAFWFVGKFTDNPANIRKIETSTCAGDSVPARFLQEHFYSYEWTLEEAKRFALLILAFAHEENPSSIDDPFEVVTVTSAGIEGPESYSCSQIVEPKMDFENTMTDSIRRCLSRFGNKVGF